jgi:hypothetical protein
LKTHRCIGCENYIKNKTNKCWFYPDAHLLYKKLIPNEAKPPFNQITQLYPSCYRKLGHFFEYDKSEKYVYANKIIQTYRGLKKMPIKVAYGYIACQLNIDYKTVINVLEIYLEVEELS